MMKRSRSGANLSKSPAPNAASSVSPNLDEAGEGGGDLERAGAGHAGAIAGPVLTRRRPGSTRSNSEARSNTGISNRLSLLAGRQSADSVPAAATSSAGVTSALPAGEKAPLGDHTAAALAAAEGEEERASKRARHGSSPYRVFAASSVLQATAAGEGGGGGSRFAAKPQQALRRSQHTAPKGLAGMGVRPLSSPVFPVDDPSLLMRGVEGPGSGTSPNSFTSNGPQAGAAAMPLDEQYHPQHQQHYAGGEEGGGGLGTLNQLEHEDHDEEQQVVQPMQRQHQHQHQRRPSKPLPFLPIQPTFAGTGSRSLSPDHEGAAQVDGWRDNCDDDAALLQPGDSAKTAKTDDLDVGAVMAPKQHASAVPVHAKAKKSRAERRQERETRALALAVHQYSAIVKQLKRKMEVERRYLNLGTGLLKPAEHQCAPYVPPSASASASSDPCVPFALLPQGLWLASEVVASTLRSQAVFGVSTNSSPIEGSAILPPWAKRALGHYLSSTAAASLATFGGAEAFATAMTTGALLPPPLPLPPTNPYAMLNLQHGGSYYYHQHHGSASAASTPRVDTHTLLSYLALHRSLGGFPSVPAPSVVIRDGGSASPADLSIIHKAGPIHVRSLNAADTPVSSGNEKEEGGKGHSELQATGLASRLLAFMRQQQASSTGSSSAGTTVAAGLFDALGHSFTSYHPSGVVPVPGTAFTSSRRASGAEDNHDAAEDNGLYYVPPFRTTASSAYPLSSSSSSSSSQHSHHHQHHHPPVSPWQRLAELVVVCPDEIFGDDYSDGDRDALRSEGDDENSSGEGDDGGTAVGNDSRITGTNTSSAGARSANATGNNGAADSSFSTVGSGRSISSRPFAELMGASPVPTADPHNAVSSSQKRKRVKREQAILSPEVIRKPAGIRSGERSKKRRHHPRRHRHQQDDSTSTSDSDGDKGSAHGNQLSSDKGSTSEEAEASDGEGLSEVVRVGSRVKLWPASHHRRSTGSTTLSHHHHHHHHQPSSALSHGQSKGALTIEDLDDAADAGGGGAATMPLPPGMLTSKDSGKSMSSSRGDGSYAQHQQQPPKQVDAAELDDGTSRAPSPKLRKHRHRHHHYQQPPLATHLASVDPRLTTFDTEEEAQEAMEVAFRCISVENGATMASFGQGTTNGSDADDTVVATTTCAHQFDHEKEMEERKHRAEQQRKKEKAVTMSAALPPSPTSRSLDFEQPEDDDGTESQKPTYSGNGNSHGGCRDLPALPPVTSPPAASKTTPRNRRLRAVQRSYKLGDMLGQGSFGMVYRAVEVTLMPLVVPTEVKLQRLPDDLSSAIPTGITFPFSSNGRGLTTNGGGDSFLYPSSSALIATTIFKATEEKERKQEENDGALSSVAARTRSRTLFPPSSSSASSSSSSSSSLAVSSAGGAISVVGASSSSSARQRAQTTAGTARGPQGFFVTPGSALRPQALFGASSALGSSSGSYSYSQPLDAQHLRTAFRPSAYSLTSAIRLPAMRLVAVKLEVLNTGDDESYDSQLQSEYESYWRIWRCIDRLRRREGKMRRKTERRAMRLERAINNAEPALDDDEDASILAAKLSRAQRKLELLSQQAKESHGFPRAHAFGLLRKEQINDGSVRRYRGLVMDHLGSSLEQLHEELENMKTPSLERSQMVRDHALLHPPTQGSGPLSHHYRHQRQRLLEGLLAAPFGALVSKNPAAATSATEKAAEAERAAVLKSKAYKLYRRQETLALRRYLLRRAAIEAEEAAQMHQRQQQLYLDGHLAAAAAVTTPSSSFFRPGGTTSGSAGAAIITPHDDAESSAAVAGNKRGSSFSIRSFLANTSAAVAAAASSVVRVGRRKSNASASSVSFAAANASAGAGATSALPSAASSASSAYVPRPLALFPPNASLSVSRKSSDASAALSAGTGRKVNHSKMAALLSSVPVTAAPSVASSASSTPIPSSYGIAAASSPFFTMPTPVDLSASFLASGSGQPQVPRELIDKLVERIASPSAPVPLVEPEMSHGHAVMPVRMVLRYGIEMIKRLRFLHTVTGHCHRDQKPDNYSVGMQVMEKSGCVSEPPFSNKKGKARGSISRSDSSRSGSGSARSYTETEDEEGQRRREEEGDDNEDNVDKEEEEENRVYLIDYGLMREHSLAKKKKKQTESSQGSPAPASSAAYRAYCQTLRKSVLGLGNNFAPTVGLPPTTLLEESDEPHQQEAGGSPSSSSAAASSSSSPSSSRFPIYYPFAEIQSEQKRRQVPDTARHISGTPRYASLWVHLGLTEDQLYTPKEDIEALLYVLLYLCGGRLPWQGLVLNKASDVRDKWIGLFKSSYTMTEEGLKQLCSRNRFNPIPHLQAFLGVIYQVTKDAGVHLNGTKQSHAAGGNSHRSTNSGNSGSSGGYQGFFMQPSDNLPLGGNSGNSGNSGRGNASSGSRGSVTTGIDPRVLNAAIQGGLQRHSAPPQGQGAFGSMPIAILDEHDARYYLACILEQPWALEAVPIVADNAPYTALQRMMRDVRRAGRPLVPAQSDNPAVNPAFSRATYREVLAIAGVSTPPSYHPSSASASAQGDARTATGVDPRFLHRAHREDGGSSSSSSGASSGGGVVTRDAPPDVWDQVSMAAPIHYYHQHYPATPLLAALSSPPQPEPTPLPPCFAQSIRHIRALKADEWPDYGLLLSYLERDLKELEEQAYGRLLSLALSSSNSRGADA